MEYGSKKEAAKWALRKLGLALALMLIAAPGFSQKVTVDWDDDFDRSKVETYAWVAPQQAEMGELMKQRVVDAINYELSMGGRRMVGADENPDVFVTYNTSTKNEVVVSSSSVGYGGGWGRGRRRGGVGVGMGSTTSSSHTYTKGTLVVDFWDAKTKNMVFRGTSTDTISDKPEKNEKKINKGMKKMFEEFDKKYEKAEKKKAKEAEKK